MPNSRTVFNILVGNTDDHPRNHAAFVDADRSLTPTPAYDICPQPRSGPQATGYAGNAAGARDQFAALLPLREQVLGPEHPDSLAARAGLAHWIKEAASDLSPGAN